MPLTRRVFALGAVMVAVGVPVSGWASERPTILVFTSDSTERSAKIASTFKDEVDFAIRISYDLGAERDAGAFIADNIRGMPVQLVFAVGDVALKAAAREFTGVPVVHAEVADLAPTLGRSDIVGVSARVEPAALLDRLRTLSPGLKSVGTIRASADDDRYWGDLATACTERGLELSEVRVASAADVGNAIRQLVATVDFLVLVEDPQLWSPTALSSTLRHAYEGKLPVASWSRAHLSGPQPAAVALVADAAGVGVSAAALAGRLLKQGKVDRKYAAPVVVGHLSALRAAGLKITKKNAEAVDEWAVR